MHTFDNFGNGRRPVFIFHIVGAKHDNNVVHWCVGSELLANNTEAVALSDVVSCGTTITTFIEDIKIKWIFIFQEALAKMSCLVRGEKSWSHQRT